MEQSAPRAFGINASRCLQGLSDAGTGNLTVRLLSLGRRSSTYTTLVFKIDVPAFLLTFLVLQRKCKDGVALLHRVFPLGIIGFEGAVDSIEGVG